MTLKEFINEKPSSVGAGAILNICTAWIKQYVPGLVLSNKTCMAFVYALTQYLDMEYNEDAAKAAEFVADMSKGVNNGFDLVQ